jgi:formamidopyrimidine-DNA glycosylase
MPELPEVETVKRAIEVLSLSNTVSYLKFYRSDLREEIPKKLIKEILLNEKIVKVSRRSKYILLETAKGTVLSHLGMTGAFLSRKTKKPEEKHTHFVIGVSSNSSSDVDYLHYVDPRRFGRLSATSEKATEHPYLSNLGPEPLELTPTKLGEHLFTKSRNKSVAIKTFLMDPRVVVGVGNIYACESLFNTGISPVRKAKDLSREEYNSLSKSVKKILKAAIKQGGTTIKDFQNSSGGKGYFAVKLKVYGRHGQQCLQCKTPIIQVKQSGRSSWYCDTCQN